MISLRLLALSCALGLPACGPDADPADDASGGASPAAAPRARGGLDVRALPELPAVELETAPALRRVIPLLPDPVDSLAAPLLSETFDPPLRLGAGESLARPLELVPQQPYLVEVRWSEAAPRVLAGPPDAETLEPVRPLPGPARDGLLQGTLREPRPAAVLELRGVPAGALVEGLLVRPWGSAGAAGAGSGASGSAQHVRRLDVMQDHRPGLVLEAGQFTRLTVELPVEATRLALAVAHDPQADVLEPAPEGLALSVTARDLVSGAVLLEHALAAGDSRAVWRAAHVDVSALAGRSVALQLRADGPAGTALAMAVPELYCERGARRPNLVLVSLDTTRKDHLGAYGYARETTPRLDALAARGVLFEHATSTSSWTLPSHTTMLSGTWAETHGVEHPAQAIDHDSTPWLSSQLREAGWATRAFTGGGYLDADYGFAHGFAAYSANDPVFDADESLVRRLGATAAGARLLEARLQQDFGSALAWLDDHAELPFFLFVQSFAVHDYRPTGEYAVRFAEPPEGPPVQRLRPLADQVETPYTDDERRQLVDLYDGALAQVDDLLGQLFERLEALGIAEDTYVVVTADHGETFGEHGWGGSPVVGHAWGVWDSLLAVPLIVAGPGLEPRRVPERVSLVDLMPTLLELLELPQPESVQGRSLAPLLRGQARGFVPSPSLAGVHSNVTWQHTLYQGAHKVIVADPQARVSHPGERPLQLFDLRADPAEARSLHERQRGRAVDLAGALEALRADLRARGSGEGRAVDLDEETLRQLRELGYVDG